MCQGNDDKLSLSIVYTDHPVISSDECHEAHGSNMVTEDCKVWGAASVAFKLAAGGEGDNHGRRVLGRRKRAERAGWVSGLKGCQSTAL